jgi:hypothetical protein
MAHWVLVASDEATAGSVIRNPDRMVPPSKGSSHASFCGSAP